MRIVILKTADLVAEFAAEQIKGYVNSHPHPVLGLATGGTPVQAYQKLIELYRSGEVSFKQVETFNLDEYVGLAPENESSYRRFMHENLFDHIDISAPMTHIPSGVALDLEAECARYENQIRDAGGIGLQLLGIGTDGHIAFNEPGSSLASRTRVKTLTEQTRKDNARFFSSLSEVPRSAITMGIETILSARAILLLACGEMKADAVAAAVEGPISSSVPATALQMHPNVVFVVDEMASFKLKRRAYYLDSETERERLRRLNG